jgi:hypothetical protein
MINRRTAIAFVALLSPVLLAAQTAPPTPQSPAEWQKKHDMALKYPTLAAFYAALKQDASKRQTSPPALPDWSGLWTSVGGSAPGGDSLVHPSAGGVAPKLTPAAAAAVKKGHELDAKGVSYDENLSQCGPAGFPRWLHEPFLREFIPRPNETLLIEEAANEVRRVYTDGRDHPPAVDQYATAEGDSIGFWDGQKLVIHTIMLRAGSMGRNQPEQSDKMETVEIWQRFDANTILVDLWLNDPAVYRETWYVEQWYRQVPNPDKGLRIRYWDCSENPNNGVYKTEDGGTDFKGFTFTDKDKSKH